MLYTISGKFFSSSHTFISDMLVDIQVIYCKWLFHLAVRCVHDALFPSLTRGVAYNWIRNCRRSYPSCYETFSRVDQYRTHSAKHNVKGAWSDFSNADFYSKLMIRQNFCFKFRLVETVWIHEEITSSPIAIAYTILHHTTAFSLWRLFRYDLLR